MIFKDLTFDMGPFGFVLLTLGTLPWATAQRLTFGQRCMVNGDCRADYNLVCGGPLNNPTTTCTCTVRPATPNRPLVVYVNYKEMPEACVHPDQVTGTRKVDERCDTEGCTEHLFCNLDSSPLVCKIKGPGFKCDPASSPKCAPTLECTPGKTCQCPTGLQWAADALKCVAKVDGDCSAGQECPPNAECVGGKCACVAHYALSEVDMTCVSSIVPFGGKCDAKNVCLPKKNMVCTHGTCSCPAELEWAEGSCKAKGDVLACDPNAEVDTCAEKEVKNLECDKVKRMCTCPSGSVFSDTANACKLKGAEACAVKGTAEHGLCYSQYCVDNDKKPTYGTCACMDGNNGQPRVWVSDPPGCVDDKSGFPCNENKDCQFPNLKRGREGLICKDHHCVCDKGYNYQHGYCFKDDVTKGHDNPCDPEEIDTVCNVQGTGLACRIALPSKEHKCRCLSKDVMPGESTKYVNMEWDAAQGKCAFKAEGMTCVDEDECRGKMCQEEKCVGDGKKKRGGARVVASANAVVVLLATFALVLRHI